MYSRPLPCPNSSKWDELERWQQSGSSLVGITGGGLALTEWGKIVAVQTASESSSLVGMPTERPGEPQKVVAEAAA